jgi:hypothetical protein
MNNIPLSLLVSVVLFGCQSSKTIPEEIDTNRIDYVLTNAAKHIQESNHVLRENSNARTYKVLTDEQQEALALESLFVPEGLDKKIKISWHGDIEGLLKTVADLTGYKYVPVTPKTKGPVLVKVIASENVTAYQVIRSAGKQADKTALVEVVPKGFIKSRKDVGLIKLTRW